MGQTSLRMKKTRKASPEHELQAQITAYLNSLPAVKTGKAAFYSSEKGFTRFSKNKAQQAAELRCDNGFKQPDLTIHRATDTKCLYMELKAKTPYLKDGTTLAKSDHLAAQDRSLKWLRACGHTACFCWDLEMAKTLINNFL